jgi:hypothetical protein
MYTLRIDKVILDKNPELVYNRRYKLWKGSEYLGEANWTENNKIVGDAFHKDPVIIDGTPHYYPVVGADRWEPIGDQPQGD